MSKFGRSIPLWVVMVMITAVCGATSSFTLFETPVQMYLSVYSNPLDTWIVQPDPLDFGEFYPGQTKDILVTITNNSTQTAFLNVVFPEIDYLTYQLLNNIDDVLYVPVPIPPGISEQVRIRVMVAETVVVPEGGLSWDSVIIFQGVTP